MSSSAINNLNKSIDDMIRESVQRITNKMLDFFTGSSPRFYCPNSPAFGHLSSTVAILKRFIALGFISNGEIVYEDETVLNRLCTLLPQINPGSKDPIDVTSQGKTAKVKLTPRPLDPLPTHEKFAICGGWDETKHPGKVAAMTAALNVDFMLFLQPYSWDLENPSIQNVAYFPKAATKLLNLNNQIQHMDQMLYFRPDSAISEKEWEDLAKLPGKEKLIQVSRTMVDQVTKTGALFCPAYGISNVTGKNPSSNPPPGAILFNLCSTLRLLQAGGANAGAVVLVLTELKSATWDLLKQWVTAQNLQNLNTTAFAQKYLYPSNTAKVLVRNNLTEPADIRRAIADLGKDQVLILNVQGLPQEVFDLFYKMATVPSILEGAGTAGMVLNLAKPFMRFALVNYPVLPLGSEPSTESERAKAMREVMKTAAMNWSSVEAEMPPFQLAKYFTDCATPESPMAKYFAQFRKFLIENPSEDKLFNALWYVFVCKQFRETYPPVHQKLRVRHAASSGVLAVSDDPVLEKLYEDLQNNVSDNTLNLVPGAFPDGPIAEFYQGICADGKFPITGVQINPPSEGKVVVTGKTDSLLGIPGLSVKDLVFTNGEFGLTSNLHIERNDLSWNLGNVPWFTLHGPYFDIVQANEDAPTSGAVGSYINIGSTRMDVKLALPVVEQKWVFQAVFSGTQPSISNFFQLVGGINLAQILPSPINVVTDLAVQQFEIMYDREKGAIGYFSAQIGTTRPWPLFGNVILGGLTLQVLVNNPGDLTTRTTKFNVGASFPLGPGSVAVQVSVPGLVFSGSLVPPADPEKHVQLGDVASLFLPKGQTVPISGNINEFSFGYNSGERTWGVNCSVETEWKIGSVFTITGISFSVNGASGNVTGNFLGSTVILPDSAKIGLTVSASYDGPESGWTFDGRTTTPIKVGELLKSSYFNFDPGSQADYSIDSLSLTIVTGDNSWTFEGTASNWRIDFLDLTIRRASLKAGYTGKKAKVLELPALRSSSAALMVLEDDKPGYFADFEADITWLGIDITTWIKFSQGNPSWGFTWKKLSASVAKNDKKEWVGTLKLDDGVTLGSMVEDMVSWITGSRFGLEAPWNFLNSINLSNFGLEYNFTTKQVAFVVNIGPIELGFARIDSIKIEYREVDPEKKPGKRGVMVSLTGSFPWNTGDQADGDTSNLGPWDASQPGTAPAPPGNGNKYLDLRLLALGQHVTLPCFSSADTVQKAIDCMRDLPDPPSPEEPRVPDVIFDPQSAWLIGADFGVLRLEEKKDGENKKSLLADGKVILAEENALVPLKTRNLVAANGDGGNGDSGYLLNMQVVFNDPHLYGLRLKLEGEPAKIFKGLDFQIMYRQVSETVGVYQSEITLPDIMRHLSIGAYSITLPVFAIAIYTNGDFQADIGFPWNQNFARSFTIEGIIYPGIPVLGSAGFYFGKLSSASTNKVPQATNGTFNPVLVFGFGLQVGFGKSIEYGILSAGFSLTVFGILEGVLGKWNPYQLTDGGTSGTSQLQGAYYFWLQGTVGILGKLYGKVDFAIVKAEVNVELKLLLQLTYESYVSISITVLASVDVSASVSIDLGLFSISIHFSFSMRLKETFTMLTSGEAPWKVGTGASSVLQAKSNHKLRAARGTAALLARSGVALNWSNLTKPDGGPAGLNGYLMPALTMARDEWDTTQDTAKQLPCYVTMLLIDSVAPANQDQHTSALKAAGASQDTSFETLCKMVLRWAVAALHNGPISADKVDQLVISDGELEKLNLALVSSDDNPTPVPESAIGAFLSDQFRLTVEVPKTTVKQQKNATYFPMAPPVKLTVPKYGDNYPGYSYTFTDYNSLGSEMLKWLRTYFDDLAVQVNREMKHSPRLAAKLAVDKPLSMADWIFTDYFLLIARQMVQAAREALRNFKYPIQSQQTPHQIVDWINSTGKLTGTSTAYTLVDLFTANQTHTLNAGKKLTIGVTHKAESETFTTLAIDVYQAAFSPSDLALANAANGNMLQPGAKIKYPNQEYTVKASDSLISIARVLSEQLQGNVRVADLITQAEILTQKNLLLPQALLSIPLINYQAQTSDTFDSIAKLQVYGNGFSAAGLATQNAGRNILQIGTKIEYPNAPDYVVQPRDTLGDIANHFGIPLSDLLTKTKVLTQAGLLAPVAVLLIPPFPYQTAAGDSLQSVAGRYATTTKVIADQSANGDVEDLFATVDSQNQPTLYLDVPHLAQFQVAELIAEAQRTLALQHLSSMASRYYLHGLRLPTNLDTGKPGITPNTPGMWVREQDHKLVLPAYAGLYALTGQQLQLPNIKDKDFSITFDRTAGPAWLLFKDDKNQNTNQLQISVAPGSRDDLRIAAIRKYAQGNRLDIALEQLGQGQMYESQFVSYPLTSSIAWQSATPVSLPYGQQPAGVPELNLWRLPDAMLSLPDPESRAVNPRFDLQLARYDEATGDTVKTPIHYYGWASIIEFTVKRIPEIDISPATKTTYEVVGAGGKDIVLLERLLSQAGSNDAAFNQVILSYSPDQSGAASSGIQTDPASSTTMGIAQVNLSTETRPDASHILAAFALKEDSAGLGLLNKPSEFLRLLWEASITRAGGFYLYYYNAAGEAGLPDRVFNDRNEAVLKLVVLYTKPSSLADQNCLTNFMNAVAIGEAIDTTNSVVFAQADPPKGLKISSSPSASLAGIAHEYYCDIGDLAAANSAMKLAAGTKLTLDEGIFQAPPGGMALSQIASNFGTQVADLQKANLRWSGKLPDPLPFPVSIFLPELTLTFGVSPHTTSLGDIASFYGQNLTSLSARNADVAGLFAQGEQIAIPGGPTNRSATVPPGVASAGAVRLVPPAVPDDPNDANYGKYFLLNAFTLFSYQVADNKYFRQSFIGLPAGPTTTPQDSTNQNKIRVPRTLKPGDPWYYKQSFPYPKFAKSISQANTLPDLGQSPYLGIGSLLQVAYDWQDPYGNTLITVLSDPRSGDKGPFNQAPALTGYTDPLVGIGQWPAISFGWQVLPSTPNPKLEMLLSFDDSRYQGLLSAIAGSATTVVVKFTEALDATSASDTKNYTIDQGVAVQQASLGADKQTVTLTVSGFSLNESYKLAVNNIKTAAGGTVQGSAAFSYPDVLELRSSTVQENAAKALRVYTQLYYQLTDPNGFSYAVESSLLKAGRVPLPATQIQNLMNWLFEGSASIYKFLQDRANFGATVPVPPTQNPVDIELNSADVNDQQVFALTFSFILERAGGAVLGDLASTAGIRQSTTAVSPLFQKLNTDNNNSTLGLTQFARNFEDALSVENSYLMKVATGIDRTRLAADTQGGTLWAVRLGHDVEHGISYKIGNEGNPVIFAPQPITNQLRNEPGVPIFDYSTGAPVPKPSQKPSRHLDFIDLDMDLWGRQFFSAVDDVLTPTLTAAMQIVGHFKSSDYLQKVLDQKEKLAGVAKKWMVPVFKDQANADPSTAQEIFYQQMLSRLSNAYTTRAAAQFEAQVNADLQGPASETPQLFGNIVLNSAQHMVRHKGLVGDQPVAEAKSEITFTSPKLGLKTSSDQPLAFLITAPDAVRGGGGEVVSYLDLDLSYNGSNIEHQISPVEGIQGYLASSWLSFVIRDKDWLLQKDLGQFKVPMVLRAFPPTPAMANQNGKGTGTDSSTLSDLTKWKYWFTYSLPFHYPQDRVYCDVEFNIKDTVNLLAGFKDAFNQLAEFITVFPTVNDDLQKFLAPIDSTIDPIKDKDQIDKAANALEWFLWMTSEITKAAESTGLLMRKTPKLFSGDADLTYNLYIEESSVVVEGQTALLVSAVRLNTKPPAGIADPVVYVDPLDYDPVRYTQKYKDTDCDQPDRYCYIYKKKGTDNTYLSAADGQVIPDRRVEFADMDVLQRQDAWSTIHLNRNEELVKDRPSAEAFVYQTPDVQFANPFHPSIDSDSIVPIAKIGSPNPVTRTLQEHLQKLFAALLANSPVSEFTMQVEASYAYSINANLDPISLPILMQAPMPVSKDGTGPGSLAQMIADWSNAIELWLSTHTPSAASGTLWFDLVLMSNLTKNPMPLLRLRKLELPVQYILTSPESKSRRSDLELEASLQA